MYFIFSGFHLESSLPWKYYITTEYKTHIIKQNVNCYISNTHKT